MHGVVSLRTSGNEWIEFFVNVGSQLSAPKAFRASTLKKPLAMEPASELATLGQPMLNVVKQRYNEILLVGQHLGTKSCIACRAPERLFDATAGEVEYKRTGICERCWDALTDPRTGDANVCRQCDALTVDGIEFARQWIQLQMVVNSITMPKERCRALISIVTNAVPLPNIRAP